MKNPIKHFAGCTADYPEKPEGEPARPIMVIQIEEGEFVYQCGDCGAFVIEEADNDEPSAS